MFHFLYLSFSHPSSVCNCVSLVNRSCVFKPAFSAHFLFIPRSSCVPDLFPLTLWFVLSFHITLQFSWTDLASCRSHFGFWLSAHQLIITVLSFYLPASLGVAFGCLFCDNMTPLLISNSVHFHGVVPRLRSVPMPWNHKKNPWEIAVVRLIVLISISGNPISGKMLMSTVRWFFVGLEGSLSGPTAFNSSKLS